VKPEIELKAKELSVYFAPRRGLFRKKRDGIWALKSVSFSLAPGKTLAVIGESGSGKTTLLRSILGLIPATSGYVEINSRSVGAMTSDERTAVRRRVGYIPQDPYGSLPPSLTALQAVTEPWNIVHGRARADEAVSIAKALLRELKIPDELHSSRVRYALSGGQRQRVAIARALILNPDILLCDEPTAMQDVSTRGDLFDVLQKRVDGGMSMITVTHDLLLARHSASFGIVLLKGEIVDSGNTEDLLENPTHPYTRALIESLPRL
jgi:ABC-type glutathione transport system ATPase component